ncbi:MAG: aminoacetone oxidase family FAD-binding enzyme [Phycisphaeraceae bacterium]
MQPRRDHDLAVIGAGAAGLMAAIAAGRTGDGKLRVVALDGARKLGAKILVAGGGRCNVTHDVVTTKDYAGDSANRIGKVLKSFTVEQTVDFFRELGVELKREETGKLFPVTDKAQTVLDALLGACSACGVEIVTGARVELIRREGDVMVISTSEGEYRAREVVLATGGKSLPKTGSDGKGYELVKSLGHSVTATWPALVPLVVEEGHWLTELSGLTVDADVRIERSTGKIVEREHGAVLLTHFGLSGPIPMNLSRHLTAHRMEDPAAVLTINFMDGAGFDEADRWLLEQGQRMRSLRLTGLLRGRLPERLARALVERMADVPMATEVHRLTREHRHALAHALTRLVVPVVRDRGYLFAEVTAGGVPLEEVDLKSMASRRCGGLSLCGEILNVDGRIGGYNFQWAWASGRLAGMSAAKRLLASAAG